MTIKDKHITMLTEQTFEVRHPASGSFLDIKGSVADYIRSSGLFPHWKIEANTVNFRDESDKIKKEGAFVSYKNAGYIVYNPDTRNYFRDKAISYWKKLIDNRIYTLPSPTRFGLRTKIFLPSEKSFDEVNEKVFKVLYTEQTTNLIGVKQTDFQFIIEFVDSHFRVRISGGPIHENEAENYLNFESELFEHCGLFLDLDYYKEKNFKIQDVSNLLKEAENLSWNKIDNIANAMEL